MRRVGLSILLITTCGAPLLSACRSSAAIQAETALADVLVPDEQEDQIGQQLHTELNQQGMKMVQDPAVLGYVDALAGPILHAAARDRKGVEWHIHVIDDPNQVNAFATPGGHLYVFSGLMLTAGDEAELAGVLAHEAAHVSARHSARAMVQQFGLGALAQLALGENPALSKQIAAQVLGTGTLLYHSRGAELEADRLGARYASAAGKDPDGLARFLDKLLAREGKQPKLMTWLSTHPATHERVASLRQYIAANRLERTGGRGSLGQLAGVKLRLTSAALPAGPSAAPTPGAPRPGAQTPPAPGSPQRPPPARTQPPSSGQPVRPGR